MTILKFSFRIIFLSILFTFYSFQSFTQISGMPDAFGAPIKESKTRGIEGSFYYNEGWSRGFIEWVNNTTTEGVLMRYNIYNGNLEVNKTPNVWEYSSKHVIKFEYDVNLFPDVKRYIFSPASEFFPETKGFVRILFRDKIVIFEETVTELISSGTSYSTSESSTKLIRKQKMYIKIPNKVEPVFFKKTNGSLTKALTGIDLSSFLKTNKLNISREADFDMVIQYLNNLNYN